ncbi:collagen binding domain-containing protein [Paenibacillus sp. sgz500958]|uniref:collagen binding domain-containing protein n=1 Tax=Paenibacillus sp. sgz500958 TaxID=3242475 RepID=UPI0036D41280
MKKRIGAWLIMFLLIMQIAGALGLKFDVPVKADAIQENLITSVTAAVYENGTQVTDGIYKLDSMVKLDFTYALPELPEGGHKYGDGDIFTYQLPSQLLIDGTYTGNLAYDEFGAEGIGTYSVTPDNKVTLTFNEHIEGLFNVGGTFRIQSTLSSTKMTGSTRQELLFPIQGNAANSIVLNFHPLGGTSIKKSGTPQPQQYNPERIDWVIDVNTALDTINNAVIKDNLPSGLELNETSIAVYGLDVNVNGTVAEQAALPADQYSTDGSADDKLVLSFNESPLTKAYRVKFSTSITNSDLLSFANTAVLTGDGVNKNNNVTVPVGRGKPLDKLAKAYDSASETTTWTIKFNYNEKNIAADKAVLTDYFNMNQELKGTSFKVYRVTLNSDGTEGLSTLADPGDYTVTELTDKADKHGFRLQFSHDISSAYRIEYQTQVIDRIYMDEKIRNEVTYNNETKSAEQQLYQTILNKDRLTVDYAAKTVKWKIRINEDKRTMTDVLLTDTFGNAGLKLIEAPVITPEGDEDDYTFSVIGSGNYLAGDGFKIQFNKPISVPYTIEYTTSFNYDLLTAGKKIFSNTAKMTWTEKAGGTPEQKIEKTFDPRAEVKNNGLKSGTYDAVTKKITWKAGANYNKKPLVAGAYLVDNFPAGQKLDTMTPVQVFKLEYGENGNPTDGTLLMAGEDYSLTTTATDLKVTMLNDINYAFYVVFKTEFNGEDVNLGTVTNIARLYNQAQSPVSEELKGSVTIPNGGQYVVKNGTQDTVDRTKMNWTVNINHNQSVVRSAKIIDTPSANQVLLPDSFHLYTTTVAANGIITKTATELVRDTDYTIDFTTDSSGNDSFTLRFKQTISKAYILEYQSVIAAVNNVQLTNNVAFSGEGVQVVNIPYEKVINVVVVDSAGTGSGVKGSLKITKTNEDGSEKLAGAVFELYRIVGSELKEKKTGTTDSNGEYEFGDLRAGKYILKETQAPAGYALDATEHKVTINSAVQVQKTIANTYNGSLKVTKVTEVDGDKLPLEGAVFELFSLSGPVKNLVKAGTSDAGGEVMFTKLKGGNYILVEKTAPSGYLLDKTEHALVIDPAAETTIEILNVKDPAPPIIPVIVNPPASTPTPTPTPSIIPGIVTSPTPTITPSVSPSVPPLATPPASAPVLPSPTPVPTKGTTTEDTPIVGEIPLGGIPSIGKQPDNGQVTLQPDKWIYTPDPGFIGKDKFSVIVTDEEGSEEEIIIEINVEEVPKGTVTESSGGKKPTLPQTGEESHLPLYLLGSAMIVLGYALNLRFKRRSE